MAKRINKSGRGPTAGDPQWYKDAVIYELHVRAFADSDGDGIGDFRGLAGKLDYLQDLGVTAIWLLPFYPSPLRDDGYDIADYMTVNPDYGTLADFKHCLNEAHKRDIRVITELVVNHTSDQHPWFQRARRAKAGASHRDFYVWSDTPEKYQETRIIFKDFESSNWTWDPVAQAYYWHRFYSHQPDLNFDNPAVARAMFKILDFWLGLGVDGLRLDAVPYLFEREGTSCENLPETHQFLKELRRHVDRKFSDRMLLAEANQWPEHAVEYFGNDDECHMAFHFPLMPRLFMALRMEDRFPIIDILEQTPAIPEKSQWALFLRNHDELTLEMVTDEDRDYMYRMYASDPTARINLGIRRRLAPLLENNRRTIELLNAMLLSFPGTPVLYYADEIGMGDNHYLGDRNGVRTPMHWTGDRNAGFSRANPQRLYLPVITDPEYHYESVNVEAQQNNIHSLLWWMKRLITMRKEYKVFGHGSMEFLPSENRKVLSLLRRYEGELVLLVFNLSRFSQHVRLDLSAFEQYVPVEMFGRTPFPPIGRLPYLLTLSPHAFYWFALEDSRVHDKKTPGPGKTKSRGANRDALPKITLQKDWTALVEGRQRKPLLRLLSQYLQRCRWFRGKAQNVLSVDIAETMRFNGTDHLFILALVEVHYAHADTERYLIPLGCGKSSYAEHILINHPHAVIALLHDTESAEAGSVLYDASSDPPFTEACLQLIARRRKLRTPSGQIVGNPLPGLKPFLEKSANQLSIAPMSTEQSNTSIRIGNELILKLYRKTEEGLNPDLEIARHLTQKVRFSGTPRVFGFIEYERGKKPPITLGTLQEFVGNEGDAWQITLDSVGQLFERVLTHENEFELSADSGGQWTAWIHGEIPPAAQQLMGPYLPLVQLMGERTAEFHQAVATDHGNPDFQPENFPPHHQRSLYQSTRAQIQQALQLLGKQLRKLPKPLQKQANQVIDNEKRLGAILKEILGHKLTAKRIRTHGDLHLGQVLFTGKDFLIIDFEGEPARAISDRRNKRSALRDVAGMIRSFHYAALSATKGHRIRKEDMATLSPWATAWYHAAAANFVAAYLSRAAGEVFIPKTPAETTALLRLFTLEKAAYELQYELNNRPHWADIPIGGLRALIDDAPDI